MAGLTSTLVTLLGIMLLAGASQATPISEEVPNKCGPGVPYYAHPNYCTKFVQCAHGKPFVMDCPKGTVFNDRYLVCVHAGSMFDSCTPKNVERECKRGTVKLIPHPTRCQGYYDCSDYKPYHRGAYPWHAGYEKECIFPDLFDVIRKKCFSYKWAACGAGRKEEKWFCNYYAGECGAPHCYPCKLAYPPCGNHTNGLWPNPNSPWSGSYIECTDGRDIKGALNCPEKEVFDPDLRRCVASGSESVSKSLTFEVEQ